MRILMVGGSGYVARLLLPALLTRHQVRVLDLEPPSADVEVDYVAGSALDRDVLASAMHGVDAVVHTAMGRHGADGRPDPISAFEVNVASVYMTLLASHEAGLVRAVLISSISVFANSPTPLTDRWLDELSPPDATDLYGLTKRLAEVVGQAASDEWGMTVTALRLAWPTSDDAYPEWALPSFPEPAVIRRSDGTPIPALAASDLTTAVLAALDREGGDFEAVHLFGDDGSGRCSSTAKAHDLLGWQPKPR